MGEDYLRYISVLGFVNIFIGIENAEIGYCNLLINMALASFSKLFGMCSSRKLCNGTVK